MGAETSDLDVDLVAALLGRNQTLFLRSVFLLLDTATLAACLAVTPAWRAFIRAQLLGSPRIFPRVLARAWRDVAGFLPIFACKSYTKGPAFLKNAGCVPLPPKKDLYYHHQIAREGPLPLWTPTTRPGSRSWCRAPSPVWRRTGTRCW